MGGHVLIGEAGADRSHNLRRLTISLPDTVSPSPFLLGSPLSSAILTAHAVPFAERPREVPRSVSPTGGTEDPELDRDAVTILVEVKPQ